ncbi:Holliday junction resolvase RecU [Mycoplasmopsis felifaucium]|uniref:Holliday junction resolvase RecU n=1 Tax=Mycoplasmopsis felifaucium TaxID=35768 RepID=UPI00056A30AF|nr:Holliday junction resolvase RecU [Mycoplasmopsis felifaucium]
MTYKNRGMLLEDIINRTILYYYENGIAFIEKKNLPIKFKGIKTINNQLKAEEAFVYKKSTVDYIGCFKGKFVAFEAKTTNENYLPISNIKKHQIEYLKQIHANGGISFLIVFFNQTNEFYLLDFGHLLQMYNTKEFKYLEIKKIGKIIPLVFPGIIDFLPILNI